jgi:hypothetical protein
MEALKNVLAGKPEINIGGEKFKLIYNNWVLKDSLLDIDLKQFMEIAENKDTSISGKLKEFGSIGSKAIDLVLAGIKTHIVIECGDTQAFETGILSDQTDARLREIRIMLRAGTDTKQLIDYFMVCVAALSDFMPNGEGSRPSLLSRDKKKI